MFPTKASRVFSIFGIGASDGDYSKTSDPVISPPSLKLQTDKEVYRPGDQVIMTIEIRNPTTDCSLLVDTLVLRLKGSKGWILSGSLLQGQFPGESIRDVSQLVARIPVQLWIPQKINGLLYEDGRADGIVPTSTIPLDVYWKELNMYSDWVRANETYNGVEEGYESSRDEVSSVSSYNASKESLHKTFGSSLSLQSSAARSSIKDYPYLEERTSLSSYVPLPRLSVAEVLYNSTGEVLSPQKSSAIDSPTQQLKHAKSLTTNDESGIHSAPDAAEPSESESFVRGRSYSIRLDDQILLRFTPKNSESTYYFSDMIGVTLSFTKRDLGDVLRFQ